MAQSEMPPYQKACKNCGRRFEIEQFSQVQTWWGRGKQPTWRKMCNGCARSYCDFMAAAYAQVEDPPVVTLHPL